MPNALRPDYLSPRKTLRQHRDHILPSALRISARSRRNGTNTRRTPVSTCTDSVTVRSYTPFCHHQAPGTENLRVDTNTYQYLVLIFISSLRCRTTMFLNAMENVYRLLQAVYVPTARRSNTDAAKIIQRSSYTSIRTSGFVSVAVPASASPNNGSTSTVDRTPVTFDRTTEGPVLEYTEPESKARGKDVVRGGETENPAHDGRWPDAHRPAARQTLLLLDSIFLSRGRLNDGWLARWLRWCPVRYYACWVALLRTLITEVFGFVDPSKWKVESHRYLRSSSHMATRHGHTRAASDYGSAIATNGNDNLAAFVISISVGRHVQQGQYTSSNFSHNCKLSINHSIGSTHS